MVVDKLSIEEFIAPDENSKVEVVGYTPLSTMVTLGKLLERIVLEVGAPAESVTVKGLKKLFSARKLMGSPLASCYSQACCLSGLHSYPYLQQLEVSMSLCIPCTGPWMLKEDTSSTYP